MSKDVLDKRRDKLLGEHGFVLVRDGSHLFYRNPEGRTLTLSKTPSDWRAVRNSIRDIRRAVAVAQPDTTVDTTLPRQEKKTVGAKQHAVPFRVYEDLAPPRRHATPSETVKMLRSYLASRNAYKFKSEFVKAATSHFSAGERRRIELNEACLRDFDEMWGVVELWSRGVVVKTSLFPEMQWHVFARNLDLVQGRIIENPSCEHVRRLRSWRRLSLAQLELEVRLSRKNETRKCMALMDLFGRVANHLLRGDSVEAIRTFVAPQIKKIEDRFGFDFNFDFMEVLEDIAAEKVVTQ